MTASRKRTGRLSSPTRISLPVRVPTGDGARLPPVLAGRLLDVALRYLERLDHPHVGRMLRGQVKLLAYLTEPGAAARALARRPAPAGVTEEEIRRVQLAIAQIAMQNIETDDLFKISPRFARGRWFEIAAMVWTVENGLWTFSDANPNATRAEWRQYVRTLWQSTLRQSTTLPDYFVNLVMKARTKAAAARALVAEAYDVDVETVRRTMNRPLLRSV